MPVTSKEFARRMVERQPERAVRQSAVIEASMILFPSGFAGILRKMAGAYKMMLALHHAAKPREVGFNEIGVHTVEAVCLRVIDPLGVVGRMQRVPMGRFVGDHGTSRPYCLRSH